MKEKIKIKIIISKVNNFFLPFSLFSLNSETLSAVTNTPFPTLQLKRLNLREKELRLKDHNMNIIFMN